MGFIRQMVAMIFMMLFGDWDHQNVAPFLECLRTLKRKDEAEPQRLWTLRDLHAVTPSWERAGSAPAQGEIQGWQRQGDRPAPRPDLTSKETEAQRDDPAEAGPDSRSQTPDRCSFCSWCIRAAKRVGKVGRSPTAAALALGDTSESGKKCSDSRTAYIKCCSGQGSHQATVSVLLVPTGGSSPPMLSRWEKSHRSLHSAPAALCCGKEGSRYQIPQATEMISYPSEYKPPKPGRAPRIIIWGDRNFG